MKKRPVANQAAKETVLVQRNWQGLMRLRKKSAFRIGVKGDLAGAEQIAEKRCI